MIIDILNPSNRFYRSVQLERDFHDFSSGTVVKLYSYHLPAGARSNVADAFAREVGSRLVQPALPMYVREPKERYKKSKLDKTLVSGLARKLERNSDALQSSETFTIECSFGRVEGRYWLFKARVGDRNPTKTIEYIKGSFLGLANRVLFSVNGQVHGVLRRDFVSRSLGFPLIRDHLVVIADCSGVRSTVRSDLFMASRDRCRDSTHFSELRERLKLHLKGALRPLYEERKSHAAVDTSEIDEGIQKMYRQISQDNSIEALFHGNLEVHGKFPKRKDDARNSGPKRRTRKQTEHGRNPKASALDPQLIPTVLRHDHDAARGSNLRALRLREGGSKVVKFTTDAEPQFFRRAKKQGSIQMSVLSVKPGKSGGHGKGGGRNLDDTEFDDLFEANVSDPINGELSIHLSAKETLQSGDLVKVRAKLSVPHESSVEDWLWLRIVKPPARNSSRKEDTPDAGLPRCILVKRESDGQSDVMSWGEVDSFSFDENKVVFPLVSEGLVEAIYVNLDSRVFVEYLATKKRASLEMRQSLERRFAYRVFFHTLMMQSLVLAKKFSIQKGEGSEVSEDIESYDFVSEMLSDQYVSMILRLDDAGEAID